MALILWADMCFGNTLNWLKLSNSGDTLKLMKPSIIQKDICGWTNYSGTVIYHKMSENEMGYRGSKSDVSLISVKEQRVDGSWPLFIKANPKNIKRSLRCTLMGFERSCRNFGLFSNIIESSQIKIPTKVLLSKNYSTLSILDPWFLTGFSDAEGSFIISIYKDNNSKLKWRISAYFSIHIHSKDVSLLEMIHNTFGVGVLRKNNENTVLFRVSDIQELQVIIDHFKKYPLVSAKYSDFLLFEQCYNIIKKKEHLTQNGFKRIIELRASLNKGLSPELKEAFPNNNPVVRTEYEFKGIPDPNWISGFATGDSSFRVSIEKSSSKIGKRVRLCFDTCLHIREKELLKGIANYFSSYDSNLTKEMSIQCSEKNNTCLLQFRNNSDIENKIIPFFKEYSIKGVKALDFNDWCKVAELVKNKEHLTIDGLNKITEIANGINLNRKW